MTLPMLLELLANTPTSTGFTPEQVAALVIAIIAALGGGGFLGKKISDAKRIRVEPSPLPVEIVKNLATKDELDEVEKRIAGEFKKIESALAKEREVARTAQGNLHARADKTAEALAEVRGELNQINENLGRLLDLAMKRPTR